MLLSLICLGSVQGQKDKFEVGLRMGLQDHNVMPLETLSISSASQLIEVSIDEIDYGFHAGVYCRLKLLGLIIEPAVLLNSQSINYKVTSTDDNGMEVESIKKEYYQNIDFPLLFGVKIAFVKIHVGPVVHFHLNSTSELFDVAGFEQKFNEASFGYQGGIGLDFKKLRLQLNYEGNFSRFGNHLVFDGQSYNFSENPSRLIGSIGVAF